MAFIRLAPRKLEISTGLMRLQGSEKGLTIFWHFIRKQCIDIHNTRKLQSHHYSIILVISHVPNTRNFRFHYFSMNFGSFPLDFRPFIVCGNEQFVCTIPLQSGILALLYLEDRNIDMHICWTFWGDNFWGSYSFLKLFCLFNAYPAFHYVYSIVK